MVPHRHGRHSAARRSGGAARGAPLVAFLAVVALSVGGWALLGRGSAPRPAADVRAVAAPADDAAPLPAPAAGSSDRGSRGTERVATIPRLGSLVTAPPRTTAGPTPPARTSNAPATGTPPAPGRSPAPPVTSAAPSASAGTASFEAEVTRLTNIERAQNGCGALRVDSRLQTAAELHSADMVDRNYFDHTTPDGQDPGDRAAAQGYPSWSGENIAEGYPTPADVVQGWMNSPGHRANILNCQSKATGVGFDPRKDMWTQMFGFV